MLQSIRDYPLLYGVLAAIAALCLFAWVMAMRASRRRQAEKNALIAELEHEKELRQAFRLPTQQQLIDAPAERLIEGLSCQVQMLLEKEEDPQAAFDALSEPQRLVYALGFVVQDGRARLSDFFRKNGQPLTGAAAQAVMLLTGGDYAEIFFKEYDAFDVDNEAVSMFTDQIAALDERFADLAEEFGDERYADVRNYILSNLPSFSVDV